MTINSIAPGGIVTPDQRLGLDEAGERRLAKPSPFAEAQVQIGRAGDGTDYVGPALLLASDAGKYMTGQVVVVDGGWTPGDQARADEMSRCVYSCAGLVEHLIGQALLDHEAVLHDLDRLGQVADEARGRAR